VKRWWAGWRAALRLARREGRRAKGRSALVLAMITVPVAGMVFLAVNFDTFTLTGPEEADRLMGTAQIAAKWPHDYGVEQHPTDSHFLFGISKPRDNPPVPPPPSQDRLLALLPPGSRAITDERTSLSVRTATGVGSITVRMLDYADPIAQGIYHPLSGSVPSTVDEVALTPAAADRLGTGVGGTVQLADGSRTFRVVALVEDPGDLKAGTMLLRPGALPETPVDQWREQRTWLVSTPGPITWAQVQELNQHGIVAISRYVMANPPSDDEIDPSFQEYNGDDDATLGFSLLFGGLAVLEIVLLAGPAFAVGARRRRRDLALVAAAGGTQAHLRRIVLADGVVLGTLAAGLGIVLGIGIAAATVPYFEGVWNHRIGAFRVFPTALVALAGAAVLTGLLAAVVPAWAASRQDVVAGLAGRRGIVRSKRRWLVLGGVAGVIGVVVAALGAWQINVALILGGLVLAELGLILGTPALVGLIARLGRWLPLAPRIALRDTSRNRTAAAPAISAVMGVVIASLALGIVVIAADGQSRERYRGGLSRPGDVYLAQEGPPDGVPSDRPTEPQGVPADAIATIRSFLPVSAVHRISEVNCSEVGCPVDLQVPADRLCPYEGRVLGRDPTRAEQRAARQDARCAGVGRLYSYFDRYYSDGGIVIAIDPDSAGAVANLTPEDAALAAAALRDGKVVVDSARYVTSDRVTLGVVTFINGERHVNATTAPAFVLPHGTGAPIAMMTEATARSLGYVSRPAITLATTSRMPTVAEQDRARAALGEQFRLTVQSAPGSNTSFLLVMTIVAAIITIAAAAMATGLTAADSRADLGTLAAVGASPGVRRLLTLSQTGVIAGLGSLLGVVAGVGASTAVLFALNKRFGEVWPAPPLYPIDVPWLNVAVTLVLVPAVAMLGAGLLTRSRLPIERRL